MVRDSTTRIHDFNCAGRPFSTTEVIIERLLAGLLVFMPFAFGVVHAWSEEIVIVLSGTIAICLVLRLAFCREQALTWSWAYVPVGLFLLLVVFQLVPLPSGLIRIISPNTAGLKTQLLSDLPDSDNLLKSMTLSFYPYATRHNLRLVLCTVAVFMVVLNVFRRPDQIKRLLLVIAVVGGIVALITLAQNIFGNGKIYWFIYNKNCKGYSGPFVNHSNYGQFMNLSIGAALAALVVKLREDFGGKALTAAVVFDYLGSKSARTLWLLVGIISFAAASIFVSLTRGGMIGMLIAAIFTTILIGMRKSVAAQGWIIAVIALIAFTCVLYIGFDAVYERLASLRDFDEAESGRLQILKDIGVLLGKFPLVGTGLGTHSVVYPMFERSTIPVLAAHAENEYAQLAEETGLAGLAMLMIFGIMVWLSYAKNLCNSNLPICSAAYGLGFGLLAILIHSLSDFGQHLPANSVLSAIFCALLLRLALYADERKVDTKIILPFRKFRSATVAVLLGVCVVWVWAVFGANKFRLAEAHWRKVLDIEKTLAENRWQGTDAEYEDLIWCASQAVACDPESIKYQHWLNVYHWRSIGRKTDPDSGNVIISEQSMPAVRSLVDELNKACALCPTYGPSYSIVGQIEKFILGDDRGVKKIREGFRLAPCDAIACFVAGRLDVLEGKVDHSVEKFERAVRLDRRLFKDVVDIYIHYLSRPDLAVSMAGDDIAWLNYVVGVLEDMQYVDLAKLARNRMKDLLEAQCARGDASARIYLYLGNIYRKQQKDEAAIEYYRQALAMDYGRVHWRLEFARLLAKKERIPEAMHEARICLRLRPQLKAAQRLLADLSLHPGSLDGEDKLP